MQSEQGERIGVKEKLSYSLGDVACNVVFALTMSMSTYFYTNVIGMSAALVGVILMVSRIFDGISDVIIGILVDRTHSKHGKARVWILRMILPYGISAVLMFMVPSNATEIVQAIYVFVTYNLAVTFVYTALNLPYGTMATLMSKDQGERSMLNIYRMSMSPLGALVVTALTMPLINRLGDDQKAWITVTVVYAIIAMGMLLLCFLGCRERIVSTTEDSKSKLSLRVSFGCMAHNKYWWLVVLMFLAWAVYFTLNSTMLTYYAQYELGNNELMSRLPYSASSVGYKVGGGLTNAMIGLIMENAGFVGVQNITESAHQAIAGLYLYVPFVAWGLMLVFLLLYKLDREYPEVVRQLQAGQFFKNVQTK